MTESEPSVQSRRTLPTTAKAPCQRPKASPSVRKARSALLRQPWKPSGALRKLAGALLFLGGPLADHAETVAAAIGRARLGYPVLVGNGRRGAFRTRRNRRHERRYGPLARLRGDRCRRGRGYGRRIRGDSARRAAPRRSVRSGRSTALVFAQAKGFGIESIEPLADVRGVTLVGGGTPGEAPILAVDREGNVVEGPHRRSRRATADPGPRACLGRVPPAHAAQSHHGGARSDRAPHRRRAGSRRAARRRVGARRAAPRARRARSAARPPASDDPQEPAPRAELLVRGIQGVDPSQGAILVSEEARVGLRMAFAVRDPVAARADLETASRELARDIAGAQPLFGIYVSCAGRGTALYGSRRRRRADRSGALSRTHRSSGCTRRSRSLRARGAPPFSSTPV